MTSLFKRACQVMPGGVNSPVRAFNGVGGDPLFVRSGKGARITSVDGRKFDDYCCSWGAMILGHGNAEVVRAVSKRIAQGSTFGIATEEEVKFAERIASLVPGAEMVRAVCSGTEAVMTALRLARGVTGRKLIVKFDGCYHGHSDAVLVRSGSGVLTMGAVSSAGVTDGAVRDTIVVPYNDTKAVELAFAKHGDRIAAVIVEPVAGNIGLVPPESGFLKFLRRITSSNGALLICDEVINGFRFAFSSYSHAIAKITPDLVTLGKVVGGGMPLAVVAGKRKYMRFLAPAGPVYQAGTLAGNPPAVVAGLKTLEILERTMPYGRMASLAGELQRGICGIAEKKGLPISVQRVGGVFTIFAREELPRNLVEVRECDTALYARIFHHFYDSGVYIAPSQFEVNFVSAAHTEREIARFIRAFKAI